MLLALRDDHNGKQGSTRSLLGVDETEFDQIQRVLRKDLKEIFYLNPKQTKFRVNHKNCS